MSVFPILMNLTAKLYFNSFFRTCNFPYVSVFKPRVRHFYLIAVYNFLFEKTVFITDCTSVSR